MECSTPGYPVLHHLPELAQAHVHWVSDAIQPSHPVVSFSSRLQSFPACYLLVCFHSLFSMSLSHFFQLSHRSVKSLSILFLTVSFPYHPHPQSLLKSSILLLGSGLCSLGFLCSCCSGPAFHPCLCGSPDSWIPCLTLSSPSFNRAHPPVTSWGSVMQEINFWNLACLKMTLFCLYILAVVFLDITWGGKWFPFRTVRTFLHSQASRSLKPFGSLQFLCMTSFPHPFERF